VERRRTNVIDVNRKEFLLSPAWKQYCESIRRALTITGGSYEGSDEKRGGELWRVKG